MSTWEGLINNKIWSNLKNDYLLLEKCYFKCYVGTKVLIRVLVMYKLCFKTGI